MNKRTKHSTQERWHILGPGAIGCLCAALLVKGGSLVTLIVKHKQRLSQLPAEGITLSDDLETHTYAVQAQTIGSSQDTAHKSIQQLLITLKAQDTLKAFRKLVPYLAPNATIILLQNGLGNHRALNKSYPHLSLYLASTTHGCFQESPFKIRHCGKGRLYIGKGVNFISSRLNEASIAALLDSDLNVCLDECIEKRLWEKLAINAGINGLSAILGCRNGEILHSKQGEYLIDKLCKETEQVFKYSGIQLETPIMELVYNTLNITSNNFSSMLQDIRQGKKTEIDHINGYLLKQAAKLGLDVPFHTMLVALVHCLQSRPRSS